MKEKGLVDRMCAYNKAISEPTRMKMIKILGSHADDPLNVSQIADLLGISQPAATKNLKIMEEVGLFRRERVGMSVYYTLVEENLMEYGRLVQDAFAHRSTPCVNRYDCHTCPYEATCN